MSKIVCFGENKEKEDGCIFHFKEDFSLFKMNRSQLWILT